jgi:hypothetical protein
MLIPLFVILAFGLIVAGVACIYWPAGLIVAGVLILADLIHLMRKAGNDDHVPR